MTTDETPQTPAQDPAPQDPAPLDPARESEPQESEPQDPEPQAGPSEPASDTSPGSAARRDPAPARLRPRSGPIFWGALVLVFCAYVLMRTLGGAVDATTWIIATIIGLGALLLLVGVAVLVRNARDRR